MLRTLCIASGLICATLLAGEASAPPNEQLNKLKAYFAQRVSQIEGQLDVEIKSKEDWLEKKDEYRRQLAEMLGLDPFPQRTDLHATKTGEFEYEGIIVENLHYQPMPGWYVTANLYRPKKIDLPLPAILYGCGHSHMLYGGSSIGNKAGYEHHGVWYAKHGFVCLVYDTVQLGEIRGEHHGTYDQGRFWWWSRGYTPAGAEAWAGIRGLDYLETRSEVDKNRFGVDGRSGGGAYSWYVAALDERVKCATPTAGITSLHNHVVDGCVEGHCDCMYFVNTYRWDYDKLAALVAPRPLCICNNDKDPIFPLDGVMKIYNSTRRIYKLLGAEKNIGLQIAEGPHADTQPLNIGEFHWMTRFLQEADPKSTLDSPAVHGLEIWKLRVFKEIPKDERNSRLDESFVQMAAVKLPENKADWAVRRDDWMKDLREKCFAAWAKKTIDSTLKQLEQPPGVAGNARGEPPARYSLETDPETQCGLWLAMPQNKQSGKVERVEITIAGTDTQPWDLHDPFSGAELMTRASAKPDIALAQFNPQSIGAPSWDEPLPKDADLKTLAQLRKAHAQLLRRFYLLGETLNGQQVWDIRCAIHALRKMDAFKDAKIVVKASGTQAGNALFAAIFEDNLILELTHVPHSLMPPVPEKGSPVTGDEPVYLNVLKYLDMPQAAALAGEKNTVTILDDDRPAWNFALDATKKFEFPNGKGVSVLPVRETK